MPDAPGNQPQGLRLVFMGTPEFAVASLAVLVDSGFEIAGVITAPDRPAGRGRQLQYSAVKQYALQIGLRVLQPTNLKSEAFQRELQELGADLFVVVAFRMLPEAVWSMPPRGTINLHASLLPQYRGAAPINRAIMNGETETGVTTFFIRQEIDTGDLLLQEKVPIGPDETAGELHDRLMHIGAGLVLETVRAIASETVRPIPQHAGEAIKTAPKIFREDCEIDWNRPVREVYNQIRGLSPYPAAFTDLHSKSLKVYRADVRVEDHDKPAGLWESDGAAYLRVYGPDGWLDLTEVQLEGKRRLPVGDFLRGYTWPA